MALADILAVVSVVLALVGGGGLLDYWRRRRKQLEPAPPRSLKDDYKDDYRAALNELDAVTDQVGFLLAVAPATASRLEDRNFPNRIPATVALCSRGPGLHDSYAYVRAIRLDDLLGDVRRGGERLEVKKNLEFELRRFTARGPDDDETKIERFAQRLEEVNMEALRGAFSQYSALRKLTDEDPSLEKAVRAELAEWWDKL